MHLENIFHALAAYDAERPVRPVILLMVIKNEFLLFIFEAPLCIASRSPAPGGNPSSRSKEPPHESAYVFPARSVRRACPRRPARCLRAAGERRSAEGNPHRGAGRQRRQFALGRRRGRRALHPAVAGEGVRQRRHRGEMELLQGRRSGGQRSVRQRPGGLRLPRRPGGDHRQVRRPGQPPAGRYRARGQPLSRRAAGLRDQDPGGSQGQARRHLPRHRQPVVVRQCPGQRWSQREGPEGDQPRFQRRPVRPRSQADRCHLGPGRTVRPARPRARGNSAEHPRLERRRHPAGAAGRLRGFRRCPSGHHRAAAQGAVAGPGLAGPRGEPRRLHRTGVEAGQLPGGDPAERVPWPQAGRRPVAAPGRRFPWPAGCFDPGGQAFRPDPSRIQRRAVGRAGTAGGGRQAGEGQGRGAGGG